MGGGGLEIREERDKAKRSDFEGGERLGVGRIGSEVILLDPAWRLDCQRERES